MKVRSPAWIILAGALFIQGSGILSTTGSALIGIDSAIRATIDLKALVARIAPKPKFEPIKPVVIPKKAPVKK
jgi:hypothetical protein